MDEVFDAAWGARFGGRHSAIEAELATLVDVHGASLADQPKQLRLWLTQACPDATDRIAALVAAAEAGVATRLRGASDDDALPALFARCVGDVQRHGIDEVDWAWWAVRTWAHAFALPTSGKAKAPIATPPGAARTAFAPWMTDAPAPTPVARAMPPPPVSPPVVEAPANANPVVSGERRPRVVSPLPIAPIASPEPAAAIEDVASHRQLDPVVPLDPLTDAEPARLALVDDVPNVASFAPIEIPPNAPAPATPFAVPSADIERPARPTSATRRPAAIAAVAAVAVVALFVLGFGAWRWTTSRTSSSTITETSSPPVAAAPVAPVEPARSASPATSVARDASLAPSDAPSDPAPVAERFIEPPTATAEPAPSSSVTATTPLQPATVAAATGQPVAPRAHRPVIARIDVPRIVDGEPFAIVVRFASDPKDVARIERHVTAAAGAWPRSGSVEYPAGARVTDALAVPFRGIAAPAQATVEFVAIGRDGSRSPPGSVRLTVASAPRAAGSAASASSAASAASAAPPPPATTATGCAPATCGVVTGSRQLETGAGVAIYQITVRNDARDTLSFTVPYRLQSGMRVHVNGGRLVPIAQ